VLAAIAVLFFALPLAGIVWRAPWGRAWSILSTRDVQSALWMSMLASLWATLISLVLGVPLSWVLARAHFPGRSFVRALCTLSMVLPPVVGGVALLAALGRKGLAGQWLDRWLSIRLPYTTAGVVVAQTFVAMPFLVLTVESALRQHDGGIDDAARTLGGSPWYVFRRVTLPAIRPALIAGAVLAWARALGEFGATITFAGNAKGRQTLPLAVYRALESDSGAAVMLSMVLIALPFAVLLLLRNYWLGGPIGSSRSAQESQLPESAA
jgi:molybdate transport system permease protein